MSTIDEKKTKSDPFEEDVFSDDFSDDFSEEDIEFKSTAASEQDEFIEETVVYDQDSISNAHRDYSDDVDLKQYILMAFSIAVVIVCLVLFFAKKAKKEPVDQTALPLVASIDKQHGKDEQSGLKAEANTEKKAETLAQKLAKISGFRTLTDESTFKKSESAAVSETDNMSAHKGITTSSAVEIQSSDSNDAPLVSADSAHSSLANGTSVNIKEGLSVARFDKIDSETKLINEKIANFQAKIQNDHVLLSKLSSTLGTLEGSVRQANAALIKMTAKVERLEKVLLDQTEVAQKSKKKNEVALQSKQAMVVNEPLLPSYHLFSIIPGRAWLKSSTGHTITVAQGSKISGYGSVMSIEADRGFVLTSTGYVFRFEDK